LLEIPVVVVAGITTGGPLALGVKIVSLDMKSLDIAYQGLTSRINESTLLSLLSKAVGLFLPTINKSLAAGFNIGPLLPTVLQELIQAISVVLVDHTMAVQLFLN
jgi:hypothetical protein